MDEPLTASLTELADAIRAGDLSSESLVESSLARIEEHEDLNAFVTVTDEYARERARRADEAAASGTDLGPLHGVPVAIKDLRDRKEGVRNTMGLAPLSENIATEDSITVERLEAAGGVLLGTTNTPALGHTIKTENNLVGATPTPFDHERSAGGSSGGSAAALAAGLAPLATGSDIGGSLRVPASCCHVASLKPSFKQIPVNAPTDVFSDHTPFLVNGPLARSVDDLAVAYDVLAGPDDRDPFSLPAQEPIRNRIDRSAEDLSIAYSPDLGLQPVEEVVREAVGSAVDDLRAAGVSVDETDPELPPYEPLSNAYVTQVGVYFAAVATQIEEAHDIDFDTADVSPTVRATISLADGVDALTDRLENTTRTAAYQGIEDALEGHDALITPTLTVPPYGKHLADRYPTTVDGEDVMGVPTDAMLTWVFNLTGHPVAAIPAGRTPDGLPVGLQIVGSRFAEADVLAVAKVLETERPWADAYSFP